MNLKVKTGCLVASLIAVLLFSGCGESTGATAKDIYSGIEAEVKLENVDTTVSTGDMVYEDSFKDLYGLSMDEIDNGVISYSETGGLADEISIIKVKDEGDVNRLKSAMNDRIERRKQVFQGYKPEEMKKIDSARVMVYKEFVALIISEQAEEIELAIKAVINKG